MSLKESLTTQESAKSSKTILRQAHKKSYTVIANSLAQNNSLSLRARGLMLYLLSLPDDWEIHVNHLVKIMKEGREQITAIVQELKEAKYIHHHKMGFKDGWQYFVFDAPTQDDAFKEFLRTIRVSEEFANPNYSGNTPPLQSTYSKYKRSSSSQRAEPPPKSASLEEEEPSPKEKEEMNRRYAESCSYAESKGNRAPIKNKKWMTSTLKSIRESAINGTGSTIEENMRIAKDLVEKMQHKRSNAEFESCPDYLQIILGGHAFILPYGDKDFKLKLQKRLERMGIEHGNT